MSSPATIKLETSGRRIAAVPNVSQKKTQSIDLDGRFWTGKGQERAPVSSKQKSDVRAVLAALLLPRIVFHDQGLQQTASVLADLFCVLLNVSMMNQMNGNVPISIFLLYGTLLILLGYSEHLYQADTIQEPREQRIILMKVVAWPALLVGVVIQSAGTHVMSVKTLAILTALIYLTTLGWRNCWRWWCAQNNRHQRNVLIVGAGTLGRKVASRLKTDRSVVGFLDNNGPVGGDVLGRIEELARIARGHFVDEVIVALPHRREQARTAIEEARRHGLDIKMVPDLHGFELKAKLENFGGVPLLTLHEELAPEFYRFLKRVLDVTLSLLGLAVFSPLLAGMALIIKSDSPGPVFYRAPRIGRKGNRLLCHKFRTMVTNADELKEILRGHNERHGACFKITDDPRITGVGGFLRRYSLDELPQLWNVLRGDMSLVGPRPHPPDDVERYELEDLRRLAVTPGITGLWQVKARRDPSFQRNVELDVEYIEHWNLWMDLRILCKTVSVVLQGSGV